MDKLAKIMDNFNHKGDFVSAEQLTAGNINKTYLLNFKDENGNDIKYILQQLNTNVFKKPVEVMENIMVTTSHLKNEIENTGKSANRRVLMFATDKQGKPYYQDENNGFWRSYVYIDNATAYDSVENPKDFFKAGETFGKFQKFLSNFPAETLHETIKDFHNTPVRIQAFKNAVNQNLGNRKHLVEDEINFILERENKASKIIDLINNRKIPVRVTHNDTKFNNILIDNETGEAICVIDLDTIMPGSALFDYGDAIRYGTCTGAEDEEDLSKIDMDFVLFEEFTKGFVIETKDFLTDEEIKLLPLGAYTMTLELAVRFLTDYLDGDKYFKVTKPDHNLARARTQIKLTKIMEQNMDKMNEIVEKYLCQNKI